ncbi:multidrug effflux MFS transporter [Diaphorobacter ruginosibacter]|uniref:Bcr/CflA family efflux transporter n=1 Tax=Diaphorobacter ruginosibacter TaxID=1715720 RepID=A0A7G9RSF8_9BURK|nr:multidrug effflux MFS transporter [Diaphorobacter ruginosibacter]QNN58533.1 multidrug effflux MFS transporter [Diaphorobacter ruginosibacter]
MSDDTASPDHTSVRRHAPLWLLVMITLSGTLAMHMFVPALPDAARSLQVSSAAVQATIGIYILGLAFGQLFYGPLSDALGRRPLLMVGLSLYFGAGLVAALAPNVETLVLARLFQALGGCAGLALGRAMVRDTTSADEAVRALALLNLIMMVGPGLAPLIGSSMVELGGWRMVFVFLSVLGALTLFLTWRLVPETGSPTGVVSVSVLAQDYTSLLRSPKYLGYAFGGACATTSIYAFIAAAPFVITEQLQHPVRDVGIALGIIMIGMGVGNAITRRLVLNVPVERLLVFGNGLSIASAVIFLGLELAGWLNLPAVVVLMLFFAMGSGTASPAALSKTLMVDAHHVGSAAGMYGFSQMALGALFTLMVGWGSNPALSAAIVLIGAAVAGQVGVQFAIRQERQEAHSEGGSR